MTFYIKYAFVINGPRGIEYIGNKEIRVKNKPNELGAKVALEDYLKRKYGSNFIRLELLMMTSILSRIAKPQVFNFRKKKQP